ncbi:MAG: hypothetical protein IT222_09475, partial [Crocinitomix sp.]|nr:hypothetical protein [Crocinitomix sp.]
MRLGLIILVLLTGSINLLALPEYAKSTVNLYATDADTPKVELPYPIYDYRDYTDQKRSTIGLADP